jgi:hypothetical protein
MERLRVLYPVLDKQLPASRTMGTVLCQFHPERRYAKSGFWTPEEAASAIQQAEEMYREIVPNLAGSG